MTDAAAFHPASQHLYDWFVSYCGTFRGKDADGQRSYDLKALHTRKVCEAARLIARGGSARRSLLAEVAALCHDLGRFPQYRDFGTFKDSESVNHAHLSARVVEENDLLDFLTDSEQKCVLTAVRLHNVYRVPSGLPAEIDDLVGLLRDADKIDIWRIFSEYFDLPEEERASAAALGFPDLPSCSPPVLAALTSEKMVELSAVKTLNDFKLLQLSWVYDINLPTSCLLIGERGVLARLAATLPDEREVREALSRVQHYLERRISRAATAAPSA